jgi:glycosyltransferase involved in cell wall biosynthesis
LTRPVVDVGIPTHGRPGFVTEAIESVLGQTYPELRLLVAEDGTGGGEIAAAVEPYLSDPRVRYEPWGEHLGAARTMARIVESASGEYVGILHDDDRWYPEWLERRVVFLEEHPDCGMAFGEHLDIDETGATVGRSRGCELEPGPQDRAGFFRAMQRHNLIGTPTVLVRRTAYELAGGPFDERFELIWDWEMMLRLALAAPVGYLPVWDADYRTHTHQISARARRGRAYLALFEATGAMAKRAGPEFELGPEERRGMYARHLLSAALDEAEQGHRQAALRLLRSGARARPRAALSPVAGAVALGLVSPRLVAATRQRVYTKRVRPERPA